MLIFADPTASGGTTLLAKNPPKPPKDHTTLITVLIILFAIAVVFSIIVATKFLKAWKNGRLKKNQRESTADRDASNGANTELETVNKAMTFTRSRMISNGSVITSTSPLLYTDSTWQNWTKYGDFDGKVFIPYSQ